MNSPRLLAGLLLAAGLGLAGCNYDVPLTDKPTQKVDSRLLGDWVTTDKDTRKQESMQVRRLDAFVYVVAIDEDIYQVSHSDFGGIAFLSVRDLSAGEKPYVYATAELSVDGRRLTIHPVNTKVIPDTTTGRKALQKLIKANLKNPALFSDPLFFDRK